LKNRYSWALNNELPVMTPWKTVSPINTPTWSLERNPYFWAVDTAGNQLPYIDRITMTLAENIEVANLRAIAGEYDVQERHMGLAKLPVFLENAKKGNYTVHLDPALNGSDATIHIGNAYSGDPEIAKVSEEQGFPARALARHRPRSAERGVLARRRHAGLDRSRRRHGLRPGPSGTRSTRRTM
jgi:peptide/nickel transport system substrate-binding protein